METETIVTNVISLAEWCSKNGHKAKSLHQLDHMQTIQDHAKLIWGPEVKTENAEAVINENI